MPIIPPGFIEVAALYSGAGASHECQNTCGFSVTNPPDQTMADAISNAIATEYKAQLHSSDTFHGVRILIGQDGEPTLLESVAGAGSGGRSGDLCPPQVQGLIVKRTAVTGRANRGRMFIPDMLESQVFDTGGMNGTATGLLVGIAGAWMTDVSTVTNVGDPFVLHNSSADPTQITSMTAHAKVATLRRRYER
jgi:hypothetical protein